MNTVKSTVGNEGGFFSQASKSAKRNPWVIGMVSGILLVLSVNGYMIYEAIVSNPGLVSKAYYEHGQSYEKTVRDRVAMDERLGWSIKFDLPAQTVQSQTTIYRTAIVDRDGRPLKGAVVTMFAYRPSDADADFKTKMTEEAPGVYRANVNFPLKGLWDLIVHVKTAQGHTEVGRRVSILSQ